MVLSYYKYGSIARILHLMRFGKAFRLVQLDICLYLCVNYICHFINAFCVLACVSLLEARD